MSEETGKRIYWAVCELVKQKPEKAKSLKEEQNEDKRLQRG